MNRQLLAETATLAGEIMLKSGAETFRVEDTMAHILQKGNDFCVAPVAFTTAIHVTLEEKGKDPITIVRRVKTGSTNLSRIVQVNDISRRYCADEITLEEASELLKQVKGKEYNKNLYNLATIGVAAGFAVFFGGSWLDFLMAVLSGLVLAICITAGRKFKINSFIQNCFPCAVMAFFCAAADELLFPAMDMDLVIISTIMSLVPGVAITNAVRDTLQGDYLSGSARVLEAFVKAAAIAVGVGVGIAVFRFIIR